MTAMSKVKSRLARALGIAAGAALVVGTVAAGAAPASAAFGPPVPTLAFSPSGDFGGVTVGQTSSTVFTLTNSTGPGSGELTIGLTGDSAFTIAGDTCSGTGLGPNMSCTVTVQFAPTSAASYSGTLTATGRHRGTSTSLDLSGNGVSPVTQRLYWSNRGYSSSEGGIMAADLDGSSVTQIAGVGDFAAGGVAADATHAYWGNTAAGTITMADTDGSDAVTIASGQAPRQITIDTVDGHLYWANFGSGMFGTDSTVMESALNGSDAHSIVTFTGASGVAVSGSNLYWTQGYDPYDPAQPYGVMEANLDGSGAHVIAPNLQVFELAADSSHVYWTGHDSLGNATVTEANLDGSGVHTVVTAPSGLPYSPIFAGVAVSSTSLYWTDLNNDTVYMAGLDGSTPAALVTGQPSVDYVAVG